MRSRVFQDGITDETAPVVAAAGAAIHGSPWDIESVIGDYLDEQPHTRAQTRSVAVDSGPLTITIVREGTTYVPLGSGVSIDDLMAALRHAAVETERVMRAPLPTRHVILAFDPRAVRPGYFGVNKGYAIDLKLYPDAVDGRFRNALYHEVAHYWWRGNANWVDEGVADTIAAAILRFPGRCAGSPNPTGARIASSRTSPAWATSREARRSSIATTSWEKSCSATCRTT